MESPSTCAHIFLVPRILQRDFGRLSKFVLENNLTTYPCHLPPLSLLFFIIFPILLIDKYMSKSGKKASTTWTHLPSICLIGSRKKLTVCSGCRLPIDMGVKFHKCMFSNSGFKIQSTSFLPCQVWYHSTCIQVGNPFRSRHFGKGIKGLQ